LSIPHAESSTDFAIRVLANWALLTSSGARCQLVEIKSAQPLRGSRERARGFIAGRVRELPDLIDFSGGSVEPGMSLALHFQAQGTNTVGRFRGHSLLK